MAILEYNDNTLGICSAWLSKIICLRYAFATCKLHRTVCFCPIQYILPAKVQCSTSLFFSKFPIEGPIHLYSNMASPFRIFLYVFANTRNLSTVYIIALPTAIPLLGSTGEIFKPILSHWKSTEMHAMPAYYTPGRISLPFRRWHQACRVLELLYGAMNSRCQWRPYIRH